MMSNATGGNTDQDWDNFLEACGISDALIEICQREVTKRLAVSLDYEIMYPAYFADYLHSIDAEPD